MGRIRMAETMKRSDRVTGYELMRRLGGMAARIVALTLAFLMMVPAVTIPEDVYAVSSAYVKMGQAVQGERGALYGNKPGDQSGREVQVGRWSYTRFGRNRWRYVMRPKSHKLAREIAANMTAACYNNNIGYDMRSPDRVSFYDAAKANNWDIAGVSTRCETTCTNAISVCLNAAGVKVPKYWMSGRVKNDLLATGKFECLDTWDYYASPEKLLPGDILVNPGRHTAMVVESPNVFTYELTYMGKGGEKTTVEIEENKKVLLNPNNDEQVRSLKMTKDRDITKIDAELPYHDFEGWQKTGKRAFTAKYSSKRVSIKLETNKETA